MDIRTLRRCAPWLALGVALIAVSLSSRGLVVYRYIHDTFVVFDALWRTASGETPHLDFPSPIGQAYYWPFALLARFGDVGVATLLRANALVAAAMIALATLTLPRRLAPSRYGLAMLTMATTAMTPRDMDGWIESFSFLAPYNMWAYAIFVIVPLVAFTPPRGRENRAWNLVDGVVLGLAIGVLFLLKVTFFAPAVALVAAALALRQLRPMAFGAMVVTAGVLIAGVQLSAHNLGAYLGDIAMTARAAAGGAEGLRWGKLGWHLLEGSAFGAVLLVDLWIRKPAEAPARWLLAQWRPVLTGALVIGIGAAVASQNFPVNQLAVFGAGLLAGEELARRGAPAPGGERRWTALVFAAAALPAIDGASIVAHAWVSRSAAVCPDPAMAGRRDGLLLKAKLMVPARGGARCGALDMRYIDLSKALAGPRTFREETYGAPLQAQQLDDGVAVLAPFVTPQDRILALAFANPYPFVFHTPAPRGAQIWWDKDRNYSAAVHPPPEGVLGDATLVLEATDSFGEDLWAIYGPAVRRDFRLLSETPRWRLWRRVGAAPTPSI